MRISFRARGLVQGVGFRIFARGAAQKIALAGWVANAPDDSVIGEAEGSAPQLAEFQNALRHGPPYGRVEHLEWRILDAPASPRQEPLPHPFEIRR